MDEFSPLPDNDPVQDVIRAAFDADLDISGGWGYTPDTPLVLHALPPSESLPQTQHMLASMRTYLEMHLTRPKKERYGSINLNEIERHTEERNGKHVECVHYKVEAMKEHDYETFIEEYKEGYGRPDFDLNDHFQRRKQATFQRTIVMCFEIMVKE